MLRDPVVAGMFYEKNTYALKRSVESFMSADKPKVKAKAVMVPHAGYVYSGKVAGEVFSSVEIPDNVIIIGPNHTGMGERVSVMGEGVWRTPLGDVKINEILADNIIKNCESACRDDLAHRDEHSIEVQLPFIQNIKKNFFFVPIILGESDINVLNELAESIAQSMKGKDILMIASSDLTHYENDEIARRKDKLVLDAIEQLDEKSMVEAIEKEHITMCGWMAVYTVIVAAKIMGAKNGKIINYMNSGNTSGDFEKVVGYGGAVIK